MGATKNNSGGNRQLRPDFQREIEIEGSEVLRSVQYDPDRFVLDVTLHDGKRYRYRDVGPYRFATLVTTESAGKAFSELKKEVDQGWVRCRKLEATRPTTYSRK